MRIRLSVVAVVLLSLALNVVGLDWGLPSAFSWSNDDPTPRRALNVPTTFREGWDVYPNLQLWIDYAVYAPYVRTLLAAGLVDRTCPELVADCFVRPDEDLGKLQWLSRAVSALMGATLSVAVFAVTRRVGGRLTAALVAALAVSVAQVVVFFSHVGNVDVPYAFWFAWSLYALVVAAQSGSWPALLSLGALAGCAVATKESVYGAYVLPMTALGLQTVRRHRERLPRVAAMAAVVLLVYVTANNVWFNRTGFVARLDYWLRGPGIGDWNDTYVGLVPFLGQIARHAAYGMGGPLFAYATAGGLVAARRYRTTWPLWLVLVSYVSFTLLPIRFSYVRFTLPLVVVLSTFAGLLAGELAAHRHRAVRRTGGVLTAAVLAAALAGSAQIDWLLVHDARYAAEAWLRVNVPATAVVEVLGSKTHLPRLSYVGYDVERVPEEEFSRTGLAARAHDVLVLSSRSFDALGERDAALLADLLAGKAGYDVAFDGQALPPLMGALGGVFVEPRVNPRIVILVRDGS